MGKEGVGESAEERKGVSRHMGRLKSAERKETNRRCFI